MYFFIELGHQFLRPILLQPRIASVSNDLQQPGARVSAMKLTKETVRTQRCLLDHVVGICTISKHPSSQIGGAVQMWQHQLLKPNSVLQV